VIAPGHPAVDIADKWQEAPTGEQIVDVQQRQHAILDRRLTGARLAMQAPTMAPAEARGPMNIT